MLELSVGTGSVRSAINKMMCVALASLLGVSFTAFAGKRLDIDNDQWVSIGAGLRAPLTSTEDQSPNGEERGRNYEVESVRLYMSGQVHENIKFTLNTEGDFELLDGILQFEFTPEVNIWMGQMLTPADRIEMNGPYYALTWNQYTQPLFPSDQGGEAGKLGRDDGITLWGSANKFQYAIGLFDGLNGMSNVEDKMLVATRFAYNFLNMEKNPGYYTGSTYYGGLGNILTLGLSFQSQEGGTGSETTSGDFSGVALDLLSETVLSAGGVVTVEAEYKAFDADYTLATAPVDGSDCFCLFDGESVFGSVAFLLPTANGPGKFQPYLRLVSNDPDDADSTDLAEVGLNYVISGHNTRLNVNFSNGDANITGYPLLDENDEKIGDINSFSIGGQIQL